MVLRRAPLIEVKGQGPHTVIGAALLPDAVGGTAVPLIMQGSRHTPDGDIGHLTALRAGAGVPVAEVHPLTGQTVDLLMSAIRQHPASTLGEERDAESLDGSGHSGLGGVGLRRAGLKRSSEGRSG